METKIDEIADGIYRLSTLVSEVAPPQGFTFNQFLILADEPLLFHCGQRGLFPLVSAAAARIMPLDRLRWISFGHVEADECGAMNLWLAAAPQAHIARIVSTVAWCGPSQIAKSAWAKSSPGIVPLTTLPARTSTPWPGK